MPFNSTIGGRLARAAVLAAGLTLAGCASTDRSIALSEEAVTPMTVGESRDVSADELAEALLRAGLTREHILQHGVDIRNALANSGGARVRITNLVEAMLAIHGDRLYVVSRTRGTFTVPLAGA